MFEFLKEFLFLVKEKDLDLSIVIFLLTFGFYILTQGTAVAPFIYTLF